ncbi:MAG TPA: hypothetical protein VI233_00645 [Puia sp.]
MFVLFCWGLHSPEPVVFTGSTPCSEGSRPLPGMPANTPCELMRWRLALYKHSFTLHCVYGITKQGSNGFAGGGSSIDLHGEWVAAAAGGVPMVRLTDAATGRVISFWKLNEKVLHLLDGGGRPMIGSGAWSYTLNCIK